jgi:aminopeptidase N
LEKTLPGTPVIHRNLSDMSRVLNQFVYQKGGWTLHMLRRTIGDDAFWRAMREYYRRYRDRNASTDELRAVVEEIAERDLGWFFDQWLRRSGLPALEGTWRYDEAARRVEVTIAQTQAGDVFRLPLEFGVTVNGAPPRLERVEMAERRATFTFPSDTVPHAVTLDPGTWLLIDRSSFGR